MFRWKRDYHSFHSNQLFMLQGSVSHSTPQPTLDMCACLRLELGIQQQKGRRKKPGRSVWSTISIQGWSANFPILLLWTEQCFLKQVVLSRLKTSRDTEDQTKRNLDPSFKSLCFPPPPPPPRKTGMYTVQITLSLKFWIANLKCLGRCTCSWDTRGKVYIQIYTAMAV